MATEQTYGVTPPMNIAMPTDAEQRASDALVEELKHQKTYESPADIEKRETVIESLKQICNAFVKLVAQKREPQNDVLIRTAIGRVFTYGSYRLGVYGPGSDIDTLIVAPRYVLRDDYFEYFPKLLVELAPKGAITDLTVVKDAFVPIIKFEYSGISIDLIFSRIMQKQLTQDLELSDSGLLRGLDEAELRSLNGTRVTDEILNLVPEKQTFRLALRAIKLWAQRRAVYANIMGFPGGVAWAMLVARVCQLYPKAAASVVVNKFFLVIRQWRWPQPVLLKPIENGPLPVRVWNPKLYRGDQFHLMPVITPAYPSMCATFNITRSSMAVIQRELKRGLELTEQIMVGKQPWRNLFVKHKFFTSGYKYYISVVSSSKTSEAHQIWSGYVESKVRMLVQKLEQHSNIALAHAFTKGFDRRHHCSTLTEVEQVQEGSLDFLTNTEAVDAKNSALVAQDAPSIKKEEEDLTIVPVVEVTPKTEDASSHVKKEEGTGMEITEPELPIDVFTTTHYIGIELVEKHALDLSFHVDEFKALCCSWQKYTDELSSLCVIAVQHVRNFQLPDDVFDLGEQRPQKRSKVAKGVLNGKKREASEVIDP